MENENKTNNFLLPTGFRDFLDVDAEKEYRAVLAMLETLGSWGYEKVSLPLVEFDEAYTEFGGKGLSENSIKFTDPLTQKMSVIRPDITPQVSRLVSSRLKNEELPLRLAYCGDIIRLNPCNTRADRQIKQIGAELITANINPKMDAEIVIVAVEALITAGVKDIVVDISTPGLIGGLAQSENEEIQKAIMQRELNKLPEDLAKLVEASGDAEAGFEKISNAKLTEEQKDQINYAKEVFEEVTKTELPINLTVDFVETRGFEYQEMFSFSIFSKNLRDELGRGGRYKIGELNATGFSVYLNSIYDSLPEAIKPQVAEIDDKTPYQEIKSLQKSGKVVKKSYSE